ncbi:ribonuclease HII [Mycoplasma sp. Mirounga ES2805-ORL]|uniref:ribonuclease HII n=1 Tax=Mycoplasma sp. Mirounga ES2805-ORL TaxID=754514 RepID=UPI00197CA75D|nr:ribonuclease HII [Mycoplasma sp. Mirounga ES2805-ORL]QSF13417.1 ribonuclease HII [Mycoplasma sp. Mirounga ES2805-ORL]
MLNYEKELYSKHKLIAGLDEAGRGCCAGPLVVACAIMPKDYTNNTINDSKQMSPKQRNTAFDDIIKNATEYSIEIISNKEVDNLNPKQASRIGMVKCLNKLHNKPDLIITDFEKIEFNNIKVIDLIKGDSLSFNVACASILAKVTRDNIMKQYALEYPGYGFDKHKGYCTKAHNLAMEKFGITKIHRLTYRNVEEIINKNKK